MNERALRLLAKGYRVSFGRDENILKLIVMTVTQFCGILKTTEMYTLNE